MKKIKNIITLIIIVSLGFVAMQIIPPLLYANNDIPINIPQYIQDFVKQNPQASTLVDNYKPPLENDEITLDKPTGIPLYIQWDQRWAYYPYGQEIIGTAGCGPTCLSMVVVGLTKNTTYNPQYVSKYAVNNNYLSDSMTKWSLMEEGCKRLGVYATDVPLNKTSMIKQIKAGNPIIASVRAGDFTTGGHFIVIKQVVNNKFIVNDPNSEDNSQKQWTYEQLAKQIKAMWAYSKL